MKKEVPRRKPQGAADHFSLIVTTFGVGYLPFAPGTWGSLVGVAIYAAVSRAATSGGFSGASLNAAVLVSLFLFTAVGIWAATRSIPLLGSEDPSQAVIDEIIGQLIVFLFVPFGISWLFVAAGFLFFRLFDVLKPYPIRKFEILPGGFGICADDIAAGIYAGICLAVIYRSSFPL